jgi:hypothetical protein
MRGMCSTLINLVCLFVCLFTHMTDESSGKRLLDLPEETEAWIASRKAKFPRRNPPPMPAASSSESEQHETTHEPPVVSRLERLIRVSLRQAIAAKRRARLAEEKMKRERGRLKCDAWEQKGR